jgi:hypothetical protein
MTVKAPTGCVNNNGDIVDRPVLLSDTGNTATETLR